MITIIDIRNHVSRQLKDNFPDHTIYVEDNKDRVKRPAFYVSVRPLTFEGRQKYNISSANIDITFLSKGRTQEENLLTLEKLKTSFNLILRVLDRRLSIKDISIRDSENVLIYGFSLEYNTGLIEVPAPSYNPDASLGYGKEKELMEELQIKKEMSK